MGKGKSAGDACALCGAATFCCFCVLIVLALLGLGIAKIVMGAVYLHDCDLEKMVPIYLIVAGCAPILFSGFGRRGEDEEQSSGSVICGIIGFLFNLAWVICGTVWVYPTYGIVKADDFNPCTGNVTTGCTQGDCDKSLITFAVAMVSIDWIFTGLAIVLVLCSICRMCKSR